MLPSFLQGAKCAKFWPKFRPQSSSDRRIFELGRFIGKQKQTCQGSMIDLPSYQTWGGWVPPNPRTVGAMGTQRVKVEIFYILSSSGPRRVQRYQCYTTSWGHGCCKNTTVPYLPICPLQFIEGSSKRAKVENFLYIPRSSGPRRGQRHQCYTTCWGRS